MGKIFSKTKCKFPPLLRMVDQKTGPEIIFRKRLMGSNFPKERRIESLRERLLFDVIRSEVAEDTGLHIPLRIDMKVLSSRCNASLGETSIVPEVDKEH